MGARWYRWAAHLQAPENAADLPEGPSLDGAKGGNDVPREFLPMPLAWAYMACPSSFQSTRSTSVGTGETGGDSAVATGPPASSEPKGLGLDLSNVETIDTLS